MDARDVSTQHVELMKKSKRVLEEAKKRQGERPNDRRPPEYTYMRFMAAFGPRNQYKPDEYIYTSFIAPAYHPCIAEVTSPKEITIDELLLETHHQGAYILLRCITPPFRMTAIMVLAEDRNGDVVSL
ncbi:hypothetical protein V494_03606 [Pseudogymnoascus sp. VKM F-4513 (FW-928)]|nr:hypothetical protein V494_03606 [Pseudogymnoascus sp. VKM F-4513 (FW-928)]